MKISVIKKKSDGGLILEKDRPKKLKKKKMPSVILDWILLFKEVLKTSGKIMEI